jgi:precorrin-2/cobalt-factor-2 C20-methyltransferase
MKRLIGVGVGPGDPELVTVKAVRVLREADVVLVPVLSTGEPGRAEMIVKTYVAPDQVRRLEFALNDTGGVTPRRAAAWHAAATAVAREFTRGAATVAFGTLGDPNLYSTFSYLAQTVRGLVPGLTIETVPGITAMQDLAARSATVLAEGDEPLTLLPLTAGTQAFRDALIRPGTVVGYKLGAAAGPSPAEVVALLAAAGRLDGAAAGARLGLPAQDIRPAKDLAREATVPYLSTLIVPARRTAPGSSLASARQREVPPSSPPPPATETS